MAFHGVAATRAERAPHKTIISIQLLFRMRHKGSPFMFMSHAFASLAGFSHVRSSVPTESV